MNLVLLCLLYTFKRSLPIMKEVFMERYFDRIAGLFIALGSGNTNIFQGHVIEERVLSLDSMCLGGPE
jgi:hypothetical protein